MKIIESDKLNKASFVKIAQQLCPIVLSIVFVFSGFVKAIDPLGSTYKFDDYFRAFGGIFNQFTTTSFVLSILLSAIELTLGLSLFFRIQLRTVSIATVLFMACMTPLTLYIALKKNLVTDCGCFGDAWHISNWATFYKNLILSTLSISLLFYAKNLKPYIAKKGQLKLMALFFTMSVGLSLYCFSHLPLIDFLPYKTGVNIPQAMYVPEDAPVDKYETSFIYEKNGVQKEFTLENYPKDDPAWKFIDQKTTLIEEGYKAPIHDFVIENDQFEDITDQVIYYPGYSYLLVMYDLNKTSTKGLEKAVKLYQFARKNGIRFYALTGSSDDDIQKFKYENKLGFQFYKTDATTLKSMIRANPGVLLLKNGTIEGKWNWRDF